jgi:hypothetical protein
MFKITINHKSGRKSYPIYTEKEAVEEGLDFKHWKEADEGNFCISDDGYVAEVIKRKEYESDRAQATLYIRTPYGYIMHNPNYKTQSRSHKWKNLALAYVSTNFDADLAIDMVMGQTTPQQRRRWKRNIRTEEFKKVVREELDVLLKESGKDKEYVMDLLEEAIQIAKKKEDVSNLMRAVEKLMNLHGMDDKDTIKTTRQIEGVSTKKLIADVLQEEQKLKLTEVTEQDNGELRSTVRETSSTQEV